MFGFFEHGKSYFCSADNSISKQQMKKNSNICGSNLSLFPRPVSRHWLATACLCLLAPPIHSGDLRNPPTPILMFKDAGDVAWLACVALGHGRGLGSSGRQAQGLEEDRARQGQQNDVP